MTTEELLKVHEVTCGKARQIMRVKNSDYSGGSGDPFSNFRISEMFNVPAEIGILMRCTDKFKRIESFVRAGTLQVKNEPVDDAIEDVINYMVLLKGVIEMRRKVGSEKKLADVPVVECDRCGAVMAHPKFLPDHKCVGVK
jgi:hypothetical protein